MRNHLQDETSIKDRRRLLLECQAGEAESLYPYFIPSPLTFVIYSCFTFEVLQTYSGNIALTSLPARKTYLDNTKLADTTLFQSGAARYFYISGPNKTENGARLFISNLRIYGVSK